MLHEGRTEDVNPTIPNRRIDIVPEVEHIRYSDDGYEAVFLAPGKNFDLEPSTCASMESPESMQAHGFSIDATPIAWVSLSKTFPVILFDRGPGSTGRAEKLVNIPDNKPNVEVKDRFFLLGEEGYIQIGVSYGGQTERKELKAFTSFNPGDRLFLGRSYAEEFNSDMNSHVSEKHLVIEAGLNGKLRFTDCYSTNGTTIKFLPAENL